MKNQCTILLAFLLLFFSASSQTLLPGFWQTNGEVDAILQQGNTIYIGGNFTRVGPSVPYGAAVDINAGTADLSFPILDGQVYAAVPDGSGGWYVGGNFLKAGTQTSGFAAITAGSELGTGSLRTSSDGGKAWQPIDADPQDKVAIDSIWRTWNDCPFVQRFMTSIIQVGENFVCTVASSIFLNESYNEIHKFIINV